MRLRQSNLEEYNELVFNLRKRSTSKLSRAEIAEILNSLLVTITNDGLNPYKVATRVMAKAMVTELATGAVAAMTR